MGRANGDATPDRRFDKAVRGLADRTTLWRAFGDWTEAAALALANAFPGRGLDPRWDDREARYLGIAKRYDPGLWSSATAEMMACVVDGLGEDEPADFLGSAFMRLELSSHWHGQFFTPMEVSLCMARMLVSEGPLRESVEGRGFVTLMEPACGAGGMVVAFSTAMREAGLNPQRQLHVTAQDIDPTAVHMAQVQLSLLGIPAVIHLGNTLTQERSETWRTPQHWLGMWDARIRRSLDDGEDAAPDVVQVPGGARPAIGRTSQLELFRKA